MLGDGRQVNAGKTPAPLPTPTAIAYTRPMTNNDHNARHDRLEDAILSMAETQRELREGQQRQDETLRELRAAALKHDMMLEMLQALQRDQGIDVQRHEEMLKDLADIQKDIIAIQQMQAEVQRTQAEIQRDHDAAIKEQKETQEAMRIAIQTLSTLLQRFMENGNDAAR